MDATEQRLRRQVPIYVNNYNLPTYTRRLVDSLRVNGFGNIIVIDQASEGEPTKRMLREIEQLSGCSVIRRSKNRGPRYFFDSLRYLLADRLFFYTDPDLELPDPVPANFVTRMLETSEKLKIGKVGCALDISDSELFDDLFSMQEHESVATSVIQYEQRYWNKPLGADVYDALVDTTFALYNRSYFRLWHFFKAVRIAGPFTVKHRPWYKDKRMPADEAAYYVKMCQYSSWLKKQNNGKSLFRLTPAMYLINNFKTARWEWWKLKARMAERLSIHAPGKPHHRHGRAGQR